MTLISPKSPLRNDIQTNTNSQYGTIRRQSINSTNSNSNQLKNVLNNNNNKNNNINQNTNSKNKISNKYIDSVFDPNTMDDHDMNQNITITHRIRKTYDDGENELTFYQLIQYYLPCLRWLPIYNCSDFFSDCISGISLASFQIPLALSYATSIAHVKPLCGLYSLAITPVIYGILGSVPPMIVGPEGAISLVVGQAVDKLHGSYNLSSQEDDHISRMNISVTITFLSGLVLFICGLLRLGFLGSVLSKPLLRSFISSVGGVMVIDALITEMKLNCILIDNDRHYHTAFEKIMFIIKYAPNNFHKPTTVLSVVCFSILYFVRYCKKKYIIKHKSLIFLPEILIVVISTGILSASYNFKDNYGISIIGDVNSNNSNLIAGNLQNPLSSSNKELFPILMNTGFAIAALGFFESTTASKSLGTKFELSISSNRELVALGVMNLTASLLGGLPSFGGYGRSKINAFSGAKTVMSGVVMGGITVLTIKFLLNYIHFIPTCVLSVITTIVGLSLIEEAPGEVKFHWRCKGYNELIIFFMTACGTIFFSVEVGIIIGCSYSIISIIKFSAKSRIQILGRIPGSRNFVNIDDYFEDTDNYRSGTSITKCSSSTMLHTIDDSPLSILEEIEGCIIVKVPEPLTFTNTEDLKERLSRLERFGSTNAHPASAGKRSPHPTKYVIFDLNGMTYLDSSASQILIEIIENYHKHNVDVLLCRISNDKHVREMLEKSNIIKLVLPNTPNNNRLQIGSVNFSSFLSLESALTYIEMKDNALSSMDEVSESESFMSSTYVNANLV
ncbi:hypothetical protein TPHA_0H00720 [Tetrapisispora phaffii CBS 4417]|uniref:STAS domain-containing protein n=1 Tax=Tetrapisispora phaffii (strain ATCC 24235 / CBS 4417 / NBRC 1672 / NRRL Y-8282 / UCD 70-5) TaxID=1071381 RepID=G8BWX8_TETPH|nr:hypothetical protein TPHA_0H00720 [Tetrapisispora phaffii CBS 4417]CCE64282.1 hypothetical protein TPHA_0H00720 [Tetrapisispora phaffii CBS 4417]